MANAITGWTNTTFIITEDHGGEMNVCGGGNGGTCFVIRLPKDRQGKPHPPPQVPIGVNRGRTVRETDKESSELPTAGIDQDGCA
jgi:hypothetical protein